ncbi:MAG: protein kinase [Chloroflexota bacterium]
MSETLCQKCGASNRTTARFCAECGTPLLGGVPASGNAEKPDAPSLVGTVLQGRYRIDQELGRGGFGAVYRAWDNNLSRACAVKENLDTSPEAHRQFAREATVLANLSHPNLPRVTDHFVIPDQGQYLVMDYVEGDDLATILQRQGTLPLGRTIGWVTQVAEALEYLHSRVPPVFHRDIKPANIKITPQGRATLVDFGLVKVSDPHLKTTVGARAVTPGYAPPEQYGRGSTDARTDLYALAATMYSMLTGRDPLESVQRISGGWMPPASQVNPRVPQPVSQVIERGMALDPRQRYQNAQEFKAALQAALQGPGEFEAVPRTVVAEPVQPVREAGMRPMRGTVAAPPMAAPSVRASQPRSGGIPMALLVFGGLALLVLIGGVVIGAVVWGINAQQVAAQQTATSAFKATQSQATRFYEATQTEQAGATATRVAQSTGTALAIVRATEAAQATSAARANMTATARAWPTLTAQARLQATEQTWQGLASSIGISPARTLVYGPVSDSLPHEPDDGYVETYDTEVDLTDFVVEVWFSAPFASSSEDVWDMGFLFRWVDGYNNLRFIIDSDGDWKLSNLSGDSAKYDFEDLESGTLYNLNLAAGGLNKVMLIAQGSRGWVFVNDEYITELDLSIRTSGGDIMAATGLIRGHEKAGETTYFEGFTIWSLP